MSKPIEIVTGALLPRGVRKESLELLSRRKLPPLRRARAALGTLAWAYRAQAKASFDRRLWAAEIVTVVLCFAAAPITPWMIALGAVMLGIACRDAYTHNEKAPPRAQYALDSLGDAVAAGVFLIASQGLAGLISPSMRLREQLVYRGLLMCLPTLASVRMVMRPKPAADHKKSYQGPGWTAEKVYLNAWTLTMLWLVTFDGVIAEGVTDRHHYFPDFLRGFLPIITYGILLALQRVALRGRARIETLMTLITRQDLYRKLDSLPRGLEKGQPMYWAYRVFEVSIFAQMLLAVLAAVEPFLFGKPLVETVFRAVGAGWAFAACVVSWRYVKEANRAAGEVLVKVAEGARAGWV